MTKHITPLPSDVSHIDVCIGRRIRETRKKYGARAKDIAKHVGVTDKQLYKVEMGKVTISARHLLKLAEFFNVTPDYFFSGLLPYTSGDGVVQIDEKNINYFLEHFLKVEHASRGELFRQFVRAVSEPKE